MRTRPIPEHRLVLIRHGKTAWSEAMKHTGLTDVPLLPKGEKLAAEIAPGSETYAAVALAPETAGGRDIDVVRLALQDPAAVARSRQAADPAQDRATGVVVDISRKRLLLDNDPIPLTYKEFELLQYLVLREGRTIDRAELISSLWQAGDDDVPNERTIDVHIRRLRSKLGRYEDIVLMGILRSEWNGTSAPLGLAENSIA